MKLHVIALLVGFSLAASPAHAQGLFGGGGFGGGARGGGGHGFGGQGMGMRTGGFGTGGHHTRNSDGYRPNNNSDLGFKIGVGLLDAGIKAAAAAGNNNRNNHRHYDDYDDGPRYTQPRQQQQYYTPAPAPVVTVAPPKPVAPAYVPPPKNQVAAKKPKSNDLRKLNSNLAQKGVAETDARQAAEAAQAGSTLDADIASALEAAAATNPAAKDALDAWKAIVAGGGKPGAIQGFLTGNAALLGGFPNVAAEIGFRILVASYQDSLAGGTLTSAGKDKAIVEILRSIEELRKTLDPSLGQSVYQCVVDMQQYNDLGKVAEMCITSEDPLETMLLGVESAGLPVSIVGGMIGVPIAAGDAIGDATNPRLTSGCILQNPLENGQPVNYALNNYPYTMAEGLKQELGEKLTLTFDPGNGTVKTYTLADGVYYWRLVDNLWDIGSIAVNVTLDNSASTTEFNYLVNGKDAKLAPGEKVTLTDKFPIEVAFDRGDGGKEARKLLTVGSFAVAIDGVQSRFDLFRDKDVSTPAPDLIQVAGFTEELPRSAPRKSEKTPQKIDQLLRQMKARQVAN